MWKKLFGAKEGAEPVPAQAPGPDDGALGEPDLTLTRAMNELRSKTQANQTMLFDKMERWDADLNAGTITFEVSGITATAPMQLIGSFDTADSTWIWGWAYPEPRPAITQAAVKCREFGERYKLEEYAWPSFEYTEEDSWQLAAVALYLWQGTGVYRGRTGTAYTFFAFGDVTMQKAE
jgi:hypothetical protein